MMLCPILRRAALIVATAGGPAGPAVACAICLAATNISPGERLDNADRAVLASPDGAGGWVVSADIKGSAAVDIAALASAQLSSASGDATLFLRDGLGHRWSSAGEFDLGDAAWLRAVAGVPAPDRALMTADPGKAMELWSARLDLMVPQLDNSAPEVEALAHGDLARAPYQALLILGRGFATEDLLRQLAQEEHPDHRAAYIHMIGATGDNAAGVWLDQQIDSAAQSGDPTDLAALLAADLELRGPARIDWIAQHYLFDRGRGLDEIEAALLALRLHGEVDATVPRRDVVDAYLDFIRARPPMAGFVAMDLANWQEWGAAGDYAALLDADGIKDPAGVFAAVSYVQLSADHAAASDLVTTHD